MRVEKYPAGTILKDRFPNCRTVAGVQGGAINFAESNGRYYVIFDESMLADFLDEGEDEDFVNSLISVFAFDTEAERDQFVSERDKSWHWLQS